MFMFSPPIPAALQTEFHAEGVVQRALSGGMVSIDVREPDELARSGKARGALHIPMGRLRAAADRADPHYDPRLAEGRALALYCSSGGRAQNACRMLRDMGYQDVQVIGSFDDWINAGGTVVAT
jgi:rhodanese-related sulfurtransferase